MSTQINSARAYRQFIIATAKGALEEAIELNGLDIDAVRDSLYELVAEIAGNTEVAIYTHHHLEVIKHSEYADEFVDEFGNECAGQLLADHGLDGLHHAIAVYCIEADMREWLSTYAEVVIEERIVELGGEVE